MVQGTEKLLDLISDNNIVDLVTADIIQGSSIDLRISEKAKIRKDTELIDLSENPNLDDIYEEVDLAKGFILEPGQYMYSESLENVKIPSDMCGLILPRSTFARLGLILPVSQYANPSYEGHLPIVIHNAGPAPIKIPPYYRVMQLLLVKVEGKAKAYKEQFDAKYFKEKNILNPQVDDIKELEKVLEKLDK